GAVERERGDAVVQLEDDILRVGLHRAPPTWCRGLGRSATIRRYSSSVKGGVLGGVSRRILTPTPPSPPADACARVASGADRYLDSPSIAPPSARQLPPVWPP